MFSFFENFQVSGAGWMGRVSDEILKTKAARLLQLHGSFANIETERQDYEKWASRQ